MTLLCDITNQLAEAGVHDSSEASYLTLNSTK